MLFRSEGPYAYAQDITDASARITVEVPIRNDRGAAAKLEVRAEIIDANGQVALALAQRAEVAVGQAAKVVLSGSLAQPRLWEPDYPHLYRVVSSLLVDGKPVDAMETPLGIRVAAWDATRGFAINGKPLHLRGWGQKPTNEWPGLGAALPDWLHYYTLAQMKEAGGNFLRWGHAAAEIGRAHV